MKKRELFSLYKVLLMLEKESFPIKFAYFLAKNKKMVEKEIKLLEEFLQPTGEYKKFNDARIKILQAYAEKQENGIYKVVNNEYVITPDKKDECLKKIDNLKKKHKNVINEWDKRMKEYEDVLNEETELKLYTLKFKELPESLKPEQLETFIELII